MIRVVGIVVALLATLAAILSYAWYSGTTDLATVPRETRQQKATIHTARQAFSFKQYDSALEMCRELVAANPRDWAATMLAGESATKLGDLDKAVELYATIPDTATEAATARWAAGEIYLHQGKASLALEHFHAAVAINPNLTSAHQRLSMMLNSLGRRFEAYPHLMKTIQAGQYSPLDLMLVGNLKKAVDATDQISFFRSTVPGDLLPTLGTIVTRNNNSEHTAALDLLEPLLAAHPELVEAHVQRGIALSKISPAKLPAWNAELPPGSDAHPDIWALRAEILENSASEAAVAACLQALEIDSMHLVAHTLLTKLLTRLGDSQNSQAIATRASDIQRINIALEQLYQSPKYAKPVGEAAELMLKLGRRWEAACWARYAASIDPSAHWTHKIMATINPAQTLTPNSAFVDSSVFAPLLATLRKKYPKSDFGAEIAGLKTTDLQPSIGETAKTESIDAKLSLVDVTESLGLNFVFDSNTASAGEGRRMIEAMGGGVGVLDYDNDGWPDLYFAQAGAFEAKPTDDQPSDQLYRNATKPGKLTTSKLVDVTAASRVHETQFSQGIAVGDVDGDGFDDVYVCNVGHNSLLLNQGDGSFVNATSLITNTNPLWTCSAAIVDLDNDGLPEIYDANYITGDDAFERVCTVDGKPAACPPLVFTPSRDAVVKSTLDGRFAAVPTALAASPSTYSLGLLAYRIGQTNRPSVFVAVDQQANLLLNSIADDGPLELVDEALGAGVAYDAAGAAQACMGIAADDVNQDGEVDMFITNFHLEYNTLYVQQGGYYEDLSAASGTVASSRPMLGFGCQFTDLQLDGHPDLIVLNGHLDDHTHTGVPEHMPAQAFLGLGGGRFEELKPATIGDYFSRLRLGRGLAKLDFDGDGREDYVCCDLEEPAVILHGKSECIGNSLTISLVGTRTDRNAFCTRVTLVGPGYSRSKQLIAGNGYQVSNQRVLRFSVPADVDRLSAEIDWPSGTQQLVEGLRPGEHAVIIEDDSQ